MARPASPPRYRTLGGSSTDGLPHAEEHRLDHPHTTFRLSVEQPVSGYEAAWGLVGDVGVEASLEPRDQVESRWQAPLRGRTSRLIDLGMVSQYEETGNRLRTPGARS